jgi:hypothetical protein
MKTNKALKRLAKIEGSVSDLAKRLLPSAPHMRELLQDAKAAVIRAKEAVLQASSGTAKKKAGAPKAGRPVKKASSALKKSTPKKVQVAVSAKRAKKRAPVKKAAKKVAANRVAPVPVRATAKTLQEPTSSAGGV